MDNKKARHWRAFLKGNALYAFFDLGLFADAVAEVIDDTPGRLVIPSGDLVDLPHRQRAKAQELQ